MLLSSLCGVQATYNWNRRGCCWPQVADAKQEHRNSSCSHTCMDGLLTIVLFKVYNGYCVSFPGEKQRGRGVNHLPPPPLQLVLRFKTGRTLPLSPCVPSWHIINRTLCSCLIMHLLWLKFLFMRQTQEWRCSGNYELPADRPQNLITSLIGHVYNCY
jgi:hypothetical protein